MPVTLAPATQPFVVYRDASLFSPISALTWDDPADFGERKHPDVPLNLIPPTEFETNTAEFYDSEVLEDSPVFYVPLAESASLTDLTGTCGVATSASITKSAEMPTGNLGIESTTTSGAASWNGPQSGGVTSLTLEAWVRPRPNTSATARILAGLGPSHSAVLQRVATTGLLQFALVTSAGSVTWASAGALTAHRLWHVVATWDGATVQVYLNAVKETNTSSLAGTLTHPIDTTQVGLPGSGEIGRVSRAAIYTHVLPEDRIEQHFQAGSAFNSLISTNDAVFEPDDDWSNSGRRSMLVRSPISPRPEVRSSPALRSSVRSGKTYQAACVISPNTADPAQFQIALTLGSKSVTSPTQEITPGEPETLKTDPLRAPDPASVARLWGTDFYTQLSVIVAPSADIPLTESYSLDSFTLTENLHDEPIYAQYPLGTLYRGTPMKLYAVNKTSTALTNIRISALPQAPGEPSPYLEVTPDPDLVAWRSSKRVPVLVDTTTVLAGGTTAFWIRPVFRDDNVDRDYRITLVVAGD